MIERTITRKYKGIVKDYEVKYHKGWSNANFDRFSAVCAMFATRMKDILMSVSIVKVVRTVIQEYGSLAVNDN